MSLLHLWKLCLLLGLAGHWAIELWATELWAEGSRAENFALAASCHALASLGWLALVWQMLRGNYRPSLCGALLLAIILRLLVLPLTPSLSDDVYRYMHEGNMLLQGENPYSVAPADVSEELRHPEYWQLINHKEVPAAYPPTTQYALALGVLLQHSPLGMKLLFGFFDLCVFLLLWFWLPKIGLPSARAIVYGFCPLMVLEFAGEGHSDSLAVLCMLLALWAFQCLRPYTAGAWLALATASKLLPAVLLPFMLRRWPKLVIPFAAVLLGLYWPLLHANMWQGTLQYGERWFGNDSLFHLLRAGSALATDWVDGLTGRHLSLFGMQFRHYPHVVAKIPVVLLGLALLAWAYRQRWPLHKVGAGFFLFFVACTPTMHPWYLALLMPFLCIYPNPGWLLFGASIYLAYAGRGSAGEGESLALKALEYLPFYLGFAWALTQSRQGSMASDPGLLRSGAPPHLRD